VSGEPATTEKTPTLDHPIQDVLAKRWSPYAFAPTPVPPADLRSLFEAARWAPSSYNEQPWAYIVATQGEPAEFAKLLSCLVETNQAWASAAPVLALGVVRLRFARNDKPNRAAVHDLGLAAGNLLVEATARGLLVHQMIGIVSEKAREAFAIPEPWEAWTAIAIGYHGDPARLADALAARDRTPRQRKHLPEFVFGGTWGTPAPLVKT
jgi:nitroreductase